MDKKSLIKEINEELKALDLPDFRKHVTKSGRNVRWLVRNIGIRNKVPKSLIEKLKSLL